MKKDLKGYYRYDGQGRIIPGSLILARKSPKVGKWEEMPAYMCDGLSIYVCGAGTDAVNGRYLYKGKKNGKPYYTKGDYRISWGEKDWEITDGTNWFYYSDENVGTPDRVVEWKDDDGDEPIPTVGKCPCPILPCDHPIYIGTLTVGLAEAAGYYGYMYESMGIIFPESSDTYAIYYREGAQALYIISVNCYDSVTLYIDGVEYTLPLGKYNEGYYEYGVGRITNPFLEIGLTHEIVICPGIPCASTTTTTTTEEPTTTTTTTTEEPQQ